MVNVYFLLLTLKQGEEVFDRISPVTFNVS